MNYSAELLKLRDKMHCAIVNEATVRTFIKEQTTDGYLELAEPLRFYETNFDNISEERFILGVHSETGNLIGENIDGRNVHVRYSDLSMEELAYLHDYVVLNKQYKFRLYDEEAV